MSTIKISKQKNMFQTDVQTLVNPVDLMGAMELEVSLPFKKYYPEMFNKYRKFCLAGLFKEGSLMHYNVSEKHIVLNFPVTVHCGKGYYDGSYELVEKGLINLRDTYKDRGIFQIGFSPMGSNEIGLDEERIMSMIIEVLKDTDLEIILFNFKSIPFQMFFCADEVSEEKNYLKKLVTPELKTLFNLTDADIGYLDTHSKICEEYSSKIFTMYDLKQGYMFDLKDYKEIVKDSNKLNKLNNLVLEMEDNKEKNMLLEEIDEVVEKIACKIEDSYKKVKEYNNFSGKIVIIPR